VTILVRIRGGWDDLRDSLWLVPGLVVLASIALARALVALEPLPAAVPEGLVFGGSPEAARSVLGELAGGTITVTGLVFSLTVVALQMAASEFTPRLLRTFLRDRKTQAVLSGLVGSAVFAMAVLRTVRSHGEVDEGAEAFVPALAVTVALAYALVAVGLLIFFLHHVTRHLRIDVVMRGTALETVRHVERPARDALPDREPPSPPATASTVQARTGGYLQTVQLRQLATRSRRQGVRVRLRPAIGTWVTAGTVIAWWWPATDDDAEQAGDGDPDLDPDRIAGLVHGGIHLGPDRTESDDVAFGIRQLVDIALRALSTGVNDPTTAVQAIEQLGVVLAALARHPLGAVEARDDDGSTRVAVPRPTFAALLALALDQIRANGRNDTDVLVALLALCTDLAELVADDADRREAVASQVERIVAAVALEDAQDRDRVARSADRARTTLTEGTRPTDVTEAG
jgi:uncharacterized membrane protein